MLRQRVVTALIAIAAALLALWLLPTLVLALLFGPLLLIGAWEWAVLAGLGWILRAVYVTAVAAALYGAWLGLETTPALVAFLGVSLCWWGVAAVAVMRYPAGLLPGGGAGGMVALAPLWRALEGLLVLVPPFYVLLRLHAASAAGALWILSLLAFIWAADTGAYFTGRALGRTKLAPRVSPGKTWEGAIGGVLASVCVGALLMRFGFHVRGASLAALMMVIAVVAVFSIIGDLTISALKRGAGAKDSGTLFPGHGGVLDRLDSLFAAAPLFVLGLKILGLP